jgi:hypothetical protein
MQPCSKHREGALPLVSKKQCTGLNWPLAVGAENTDTRNSPQTPPASNVGGAELLVVHA